LMRRALLACTFEVEHLWLLLHNSKFSVRVAHQLSERSRCFTPCRFALSVWSRSTGRHAGAIDDAEARRTACCTRRRSSRSASSSAVQGTAGSADAAAASSIDAGTASSCGSCTAADPWWHAGLWWQAEASDASASDGSHWGRSRTDPEVEAADQSRGTSGSRCKFIDVDGSIFLYELHDGDVGWSPSGTGHHSDGSTYGPAEHSGEDSRTGRVSHAGCSEQPRSEETSCVTAWPYGL
jgi:hypothetical protein